MKEKDTIQDPELEIIIPTPEEPAEEVTNDVPEATGLDNGDSTDEPKAQEKQEKRTKHKRKKRNLRSLLIDPDEQETETYNLKDLMSNLTIDGMWFKRHIGFLLLIVAGMIVYITNGYQAQHEMIEEGRLIEELKDWRYRSMTIHSRLTSLSRQSQIEETLHMRGDTTLVVGTQAPYELK